MKNKYKIDRDIIFVSLKHKGINQTMLVDVSDMDKLEAYPNTIYAKYDKTIKDYYAIGKLNQKPFIFHRYLTDCPKDMTVDHRNHNTLDNRRENLLICTNKENCNNRKGPYKTNKTGYKNVFFDNFRKRYTVEINKKKHGTFKTLDEAVEKLKELKG